MDYEKLGDNIRNYREQRGFTQEKLAELSNISEKHLSKIERGKINIKIDTLVNIADALGTSLINCYWMLHHMSSRIIFLKLHIIYQNYRDRIRNGYYGIWNKIMYLRSKRKPC